MYLIVNPQYSIRNENGCSYIIKRVTTIDNTIGYETESVTLVPPFIGYILSNIGKSDICNSIDIIAKQLGVSKQSIYIFVKRITENKSHLQIDGFETSIVLPKRLLIISDSVEKQSHYTANAANPTSNFIKRRPNTPINLNFMITNRCTTDCIYCYAKRNNMGEMETEKIIDIICEANSKRVINLTLTGGDIFARKDWAIILDTTMKKGYGTFLSTKTPLDLKGIRQLSKIGVPTFQFSLDSCEKNILSKMLHVDNLYLDKVENMLSECSKIGINVSIRSVLTHLNSSVQQIELLLNFLNKYSCIEKWTFTPAFYSEYKEDYKQYEVTNNQLQYIYNYTKKFPSKFPIYHNKMNESGYSMKKFSTEDNFIKYNQTCYANSYSMSILSSGNCTVCEMLYDNPDFVLGNVLNMSIEEIWNSPKALKLYSKKKEFIEDKNTPCYSCGVYDTCKNKLAKKVCYVDIAKVYGVGKYEYPDPRCPHSIKTNVIL